MVILTSVGARSGKVRKNPVMRIVDGERYVAVASAGGAPTHPSWYTNLVSHPMVRIQDGATIKEIRAGIPASAAQTVVDASGLLLLPGGIDAHTHLDMPFGGSRSADDFETGTRAAAIGGTTTIVDFAIQARGTKMRTALDTWWKKAEGKACIDYGLHMIVTDLPDAGLEDMDDMVCEGVASFKLFMAYPNVLMVDDATIFRALRRRPGELGTHFLLPQADRAGLDETLAGGGHQPYGPTVFANRHDL